MSFRASRVLCVVFAGACALIQEPQPFVGTRYVLRSVQGAALPARYSDRSLTAVMISDTLELRDDGTGTMRTTTVEPGTTKESRENIELTFMRSGNGIRMVMQCPIAAVCMRPPHFVGIVSEDGIVFTESVVSHAPLVFDRIQ